jgi:hypothetical protein
LAEISYSARVFFMAMNALIPRQDMNELKSEAQMSQGPTVKKDAIEDTNVISPHLQIIEQIAPSHFVAGKTLRKRCVQVCRMLLTE